MWTFLPPVLGTRKLVTVTTFLFIFPLVGWAIAVQNPDAPFYALLLLAALAGIGGGAFSGFMPSTSYFFPRSKQGTALRIQAGIGNFGVSIVQFVTPLITGFALFGGMSQSLKNKEGSSPTRLTRKLNEYHFPSFLNTAR
jgi:NNP family nitrate/nitrite transporter-like MFS transporter